MKTIGMIGGMSWESTQTYYRIINEEVKNRLGGLNSAKIILNSVNFEIIEEFQRLNQWDKAADELVLAAKSLERAGGDFIIICTNTMHRVYDEIKSNISIPLIHIADSTAKAIEEKKIKKIGLLGTRFTMEEAFYKNRLINNFGIDVIIPDPEDIDIVHNVIYKELCLGKIEASSEKEYLRIIGKLEDDGAEGVILGCTEISLLVNQELTDVPLFDTTKIHALDAVVYALKNS